MRPFIRINEFRRRTYYEDRPAGPGGGTPY
jgi:hypothetical protein